MRKNSRFMGFVTGHDFGRADKANKINRALAPADPLWAKSLESSLFRSLFKPESKKRHSAERVRGNLQVSC
jgi:hypothetical protein